MSLIAVYPLAKSLHVLAAIASLGPTFLLPVLLFSSLRQRFADTDSTPALSPQLLQTLDSFVGGSGWLLLLSGLWLSWLRDWSDLRAPWLWACGLILLLVLGLDGVLEKRYRVPQLRFWLLFKAAGFALIAGLMVWRPS